MQIRNSGTLEDMPNCPYLKLNHIQKFSLGEVLRVTISQCYRKMHELDMAYLRLYASDIIMYLNILPIG